MFSRALLLLVALHWQLLGAEESGDEPFANVRVSDVA
jgi:hypothetical protein